MMKRIRFLLGALALIGLAAGLTACARSNGATHPNRPFAAASGRLAVVVTGAALGNLEPCG